MGSLNNFVPEERDFLASVFYTVGVWISHVDDDGDCSADAEEEKVLMAVLQRLAKHYSKTVPFVSEMCEESARQTQNHGRWATQSDDAVECAVKAAQVIKAQMGTDDLVAYKSAISEVARSVAVAFREGDSLEEGFSDKIKNGVLKLLNKDLHAEQNISPAEETALYTLLDALKAV